jgi:hypothetical protein
MRFLAHSLAWDYAPLWRVLAEQTGKQVAARTQCWPSTTWAFPKGASSMTGHVTRRGLRHDRGRAYISCLDCVLKQLNRPSSVVKNA